MRPAEDVEKLIKSVYYKASVEVHERTINDALDAQAESIKSEWASVHSNIWRTIMKSNITKLATAAVIIVAVVLSVTVLDRSATPAWSMDQTIAAIKQLKNLRIKGKMHYWSEPVEFSCWIRCSDQETSLGAMRFECDRLTVVVQDSLVYLYWPKENLVLVTQQGPEINELKFWYRAATLRPWLTGKILETLRLFTDDWKQVVDTNPVSGKEQVSVICSYRPSNTSIFFVVDTESKLIQRGKMWMNLQREGEPEFDGQVFIYNQEIPDEFFEFEMPPGVTAVTQKGIEECKSMFKQAENLFHNEKKYAEAMELCRQIHDKCPHLNTAAQASMMVGLCHRGLGQYDSEIEAYQKTISEYSHAKGFGAVYFYLGRAYFDRGQNQKALEAFESCLTANEGVTDPDKFPLKDAREHIAKIKGE